jgi:hypothetical protein
MLTNGAYSGDNFEVSFIKLDVKVHGESSIVWMSECHVDVRVAKNCIIHFL